MPRKISRGLRTSRRPTPPPRTGLRRARTLATRSRRAQAERRRRPRRSSMPRWWTILVLVVKAVPRTALLSQLLSPAVTRWWTRSCEGAANDNTNHHQHQHHRASKLEVVYFLDLQIATSPPSDCNSTPSAIMATVLFFTTWAA